MLKINILIDNLAFTFIELIIVIGVIAISLPVVFGLFFIQLQSQSKIYILQEVKRNGDYALNVMQNIIKNRAYAIYSDSGGLTEVCSTKSGPNTLVSSSTVYFKDIDGVLFYFNVENDKISSHSAVINPDPYLLTNEKVSVTSLTLTCSRTSIFSPPIVAVSFIVSQTGTPARHEEKASLNYQTKIKLRSY